MTPSPSAPSIALWTAAFFEEVRKLFAEAVETRTQAQIALAWIWTRSHRTIPIPGFKSTAQV
jgi:aryl-alcohol dehydrogenase-like predicted oxidoreductase